MTLPGAIRRSEKRSRKARRPSAANHAGKDGDAPLSTIGIFIVIAIYIALAAVAILLTGSNSVSPDAPEDAKPRDFKIPTAAEDRTIPTFFGTRKMSPNIINYVFHSRRAIVQVTEVETGGKDGGSEEIEQIVGYAVFARVLLAFADGMDGVRQWWLDDAKTFDGGIVPAPPAAEGSFFARTGHPAQGEGSSHTGPSQIIVRQSHETTFPAYAGGSGDPVPYFATGLVYLPFAFVGDNATTMPNWAATVERRGAANGDLILLDIDNVPPIKQLVNAFDMNPADIAYNLVRLFLGFPAADIDIDSFRAAQDVFLAEGLGLSPLIETTTSASSVIENFERHTDARIFVSGETGKWKIRLIRDDYDPNTLPELTQDEVSDLNIARQGPQDTFTDLIVSYVPSSTWEKRTYRIINPARHVISNGLRTKSIDLTWITQDACFWNAIQRLKRRNFTALALLRFKVPRDLKHPITGDPWILEPAEPLKISWIDPLKPEISFQDMIIRVLSVSNWGRESDYIQVEAAEDVFAVGDTALIALPDDTTGGTDYTLTNPSTFVDVVDAPRELSGTPALAVFASPPGSELADAYYVKVNGRVKGEFQIMGAATLEDDYTADTSLVDRDVGFTLSSPIGLEAFTSTEGAFQRLARTAVFVHPDGTIEAVGVHTLADLGGGFFAASGIIRGLAGTQRIEHLAGVRVWFPQEGGGRFRSVVRVGGEPYNVTLQVDTAPLNLNFTGQETSLNYDYQFTNLIPYPPAHLRAAQNGADVDLSWSARNRHSGWLATQANIDTGLPHDGQPPEADFFAITNDQTADVETATGTAITIAGGWVPGRTYSVRAFLAGRASDPEEVLIP